MQTNFMNFFKRLFNSNDNDSSNKIYSVGKGPVENSFLTTLDKYEKIKELSVEKLVVIFKYASRDIVSKKAWSQFSNNAKFKPKEVALFCLDAKKYKSISSKLHEDYQLPNTIPQLIVIDKNEVVHHASHTCVLPFFIHRHLEKRNH